MTNFKKPAGFIAAGLLCIAAVPAMAGDFEGELNILTWEGYADEGITGPWEAETGCKISRTYVGSNDEFPAKLAAGGSVYDAVSPSIDTAPILAKMGVIEPIDLASLEYWDQIFPSFKEEPGIKGPKGYELDGKVWAAPFAWGSIAWMYRSDKFETAPTKVSQLWEDDTLNGKISLWDDKTNIYATARMLFGRDVNVYDLTDEQLAEVQEKLIELKPRIRKYWATAGELVNLYANGEVWISNTWGGYQSGLLIEQGLPMIEFIPEEKADGWQDAWQIVKGTPNMNCAQSFVNYMQSPDAQCAMSAIMGYSAANQAGTKECMGEEMYKALNMSDYDYIENLDFWQEPVGIERYINVWNAIKAAQ